MNYEKELWIEAHKRFVEEHGREPTEAEMERAFIDALTDQIDAVSDRLEGK